MLIKLPLYYIEDYVENIFQSLSQPLQIKFSITDLADILEIEQDYQLENNNSPIGLLLFDFPYTFNEIEMEDYILEQASHICVELNLKELQEILDVERMKLKKSDEYKSYLQIIYN
jgi:hypothetical protein